MEERGNRGHRDRPSPATATRPRRSPTSTSTRTSSATRAIWGSRQTRTRTQGGRAGELAQRVGRPGLRPRVGDPLRLRGRLQLPPVARGHLRRRGPHDPHNDGRVQGFAAVQAVLDDLAPGAIVDETIDAWLATMALDARLDGGASLTGGDADLYQVERLNASINWDTSDVQTRRAARRTGGLRPASRRRRHVPVRRPDHLDLVRRRVRSAAAPDHVGGRRHAPPGRMVRRSTRRTPTAATT